MFKSWNLSGKKGLTKETFLACTQSNEAVIAVTDHLLANHGFEYVLPGKFVSDPQTFQLIGFKLLILMLSPDESQTKNLRDEFFARNF